MCQFPLLGKCSNFSHSHSDIIRLTCCSMELHTDCAIELANRNSKCTICKSYLNKEKLGDYVSIVSDEDDVEVTITKVITPEILRGSLECQNQNSLSRKESIISLYDEDSQRSPVDDTTKDCGFGQSYILSTLMRRDSNQSKQEETSTFDEESQEKPEEYESTQVENHVFEESQYFPLDQKTPEEHENTQIENHVFEESQYFPLDQKTPEEYFDTSQDESQPMETDNEES